MAKQQGRQSQLGHFKFVFVSLYPAFQSCLSINVLEPNLRSSFFTMVLLNNALVFGLFALSPGAFSFSWPGRRSTEDSLYEVGSGMVVRQRAEVIDYGGIYDVDVGKYECMLTAFQGLALTSDEVDAIFLGRSKGLKFSWMSISENSCVDGLNLYENKPDCFKSAAGLLRIRCGEGGMDEDDRVTSESLLHSLS